MKSELDGADVIYKLYSGIVMLPWNRALWLDVASHKTVLLVPILVNFVEPNLTYSIIIYKGQFRIKKGSDVSKQFDHSIVMQHSDWMFQVTRLFF